MSKITRRDFLKTAGVMTLAVAAAGVLSGCEGNTAPVKPETGTKALGDVITVGDYQFSVTNAVMAQVKGGFNGTTGEKLDATQRHLGLVFSVQKMKKDAKALNFTDMVTVRINGKNVGGNFAESAGDWRFNKDALGVEAVKGLDTSKLAYNEKASYFQTAIDCKKEYQKYDDSAKTFEEITKIEVIVRDNISQTPVYVIYDLAAPAVKEYDVVTDYMTQAK